MACRLCSANDRDALVEQLAERMWNHEKDALPGEVPWDRAGDYDAALRRCDRDDAQGPCRYFRALQLTTRTSPHRRHRFTSLIGR